MLRSSPRPGPPASVSRTCSRSHRTPDSRPTATTPQHIRLHRGVLSTAAAGPAPPLGRVADEAGGPRWTVPPVAAVADSMPLPATRTKMPHRPTSDPGAGRSQGLSVWNFTGRRRSRPRPGVGGGCRAAGDHPLDGCPGPQADTHSLHPAPRWPSPGSASPSRKPKRSCSIPHPTASPAMTGTIAVFTTLPPPTARDSDDASPASGRPVVPM